ncbi:MAG: UDP-glucose/GDP-mannose dehydrogenase family protein [Pseudomonadota bacterium]|nr:UDP-glucose/GDP-mannose dehydrogenase family protein [Pseudomonadota bacterium]MDE3037190.1 UDP-glucose/GDP-mannose dehydrogenase family protein [Pseudomonadota bacterium]
MRIAVIGTGYVGLVSGVCFSEYGFRVTCIDNDGDKIAKLQQEIMPIFEPGLEALVAKNRKAGRLSFSTDLAQAVREADAVLIAVGTPADAITGLPDLAYLHAAVEEVAHAIDHYVLVVIKSTVPVGTNRHVAQMIANIAPDADFDVASNPEFLREGVAIEDFMSPDRIVAGVDSRRAKDGMTRLYEPVALNGAQMFFTTYESAEVIKYAANSLLAARIAFIDEIADFCEKTGANIRDVSKGVGMDQRIGNHFLKPGPGYGGSCFPKDTLALKSMARDAGAPISIVEAAISSNDTRKIRMAEKIIAAARGDVRGKTIAILGLTFKPGTDDMREAASLVIVPKLIETGASIRAYDPQGMKEAAKLIPGNVTWCKDAYEAMQGADALVILTEWNEFRSLDLQKVRGLLKTPLVVDLRNIYKRQDMMRHGFHYVSVGRQDVIPGQPWIADLNIDDEKAA